MTHTLTFTDDETFDIRTALLATSANCHQVAKAMGNGPNHDLLTEQKWRMLKLAERIEQWAY